MSLGSSFPATPEMVAIIGLGLIGGSLAKAIAQHSPKTVVLGFDTPEVMGRAVQEGVIMDALMSLDDPMLDEVDLVILGCHVLENKSILEALARTPVIAREKPLYVMDLGSTKASIVALSEILGPHVVFLGGHPLAGREVGGFANSRADLFSGKRFLLTPTDKTPQDFVQGVSQWLTSLGTLPVVIPPDQHDRLMALVSHFPQLYAVGLANLLAQNNPEQTLRFLGGGIDDQMRLMASPTEMWRDVYADNRENVLSVLDQFLTVMSGLREAVASDDLEPWFDQSHAIYAQYQHYKGQS